MLSMLPNTFVQVMKFQGYTVELFVSFLQGTHCALQRANMDPVAAASVSASSGKFLAAATQPKVGKSSVPAAKCLTFSGL